MECDKLLKYFRENEISFSLINGMLCIDDKDGETLLLFKNTKDGKYQLSSVNGEALGYE